MEETFIEVATLGRDVKLGMLYNRHTNQLLSDTVIWNDREMAKSISEESQLECKWEVIAEDSIEEKTSKVEVEAGLKLSLLLGMVEVHGSAKYLTDRKTSKRQSRVSLHYKYTNFYRELDILHLLSQHQKAFDNINNDKATHIVTGLLYGAQAFFIFDKHFSRTEEKEKVEAELQAKVRIIQKLSIGASLEKNYKTVKQDDGISCSYYGDIPLELTPKSYSDAINIYKSLPSVLERKQEYLIPIKCWLFPLNFIPSLSTQCSVKKVDASLVHEIQNHFERFDDMMMECNDLFAKKSCQDLQQLKTEIEELRDKISDSKQKLQVELKNIVLENNSTEDAVKDMEATLLKQAEPTSTFNSINSLISEKKTEINIAESFLETCDMDLVAKNTIIELKENSDFAGHTPWYKNPNAQKQLQKVSLEYKEDKKLKTEKENKLENIEGGFENISTESELNKGDICPICNTPHCPYAGDDNTEFNL